MMKLGITIITALLLSSVAGCMAVPVAAGGAATGAVVYDRRSLEVQNIDHSIRFKIRSLIRENRDLADNSHLVITSFNQVVLLAGQTPTASLRAQAVELVKSVPNVKRIYNEITVAGPTSNLTRSSDGWLTTKIKTRMLGTENLRSGLIKVVTENGTVYLMGLVTPHQAKLAVDATKSTKGVQRVVKLFEYLPQP